VGQLHSEMRDFEVVGVKYLQEQRGDQVRHPKALAWLSFTYFGTTALCHIATSHPRVRCFPHGYWEYGMGQVHHESLGLEGMRIQDLQ
jgi:hypothetical protein